MVTLGYLKYLVSLPPERHARLALESGWDLYTRGLSGWVGDLEYALRQLAEPLSVPPIPTLTPKVVDALINEVRLVCIDDLEKRIRKIPRLYLLKDRLEPQEDAPPKLIHMFVRHYLHRVRFSTHRVSLTKLIFGEHIFAADTWRGVTMGEECRMCRKIGGGPRETPTHALMLCEADELTVALREELFRKLERDFGLRRPARFTEESALFWLKKIIFDWEMVVPVAKFVHSMYRVWSGKVVPAPVIVDAIAAPGTGIPESDEDTDTEAEDTNSEYDSDSELDLYGESDGLQSDSDDEDGMEGPMVMSRPRTSVGTSG
jgi:hypothetical protein